jgi:hypothetical protein
MRITFGSSIASATNYNRYWIIYILHLVLILLINCVLSFYSLIEVALPVKIFTICAFIPSPIYLLESVIVRVKYLAVFSEIKSIDATLMSARQKHVVQVSKENILKIIFVLVVFLIQMCVISVKFFIYETFDLQV